MKIKKLTPTKAKLPENELIIGGQGNTTTQSTLNKIDKNVKQYLKNDAKK